MSATNFIALRLGTSVTVPAVETLCSGREFDVPSIHSVVQVRHADCIGNQLNIYNSGFQMLLKLL